MGEKIAKVFWIITGISAIGIFASLILMIWCGFIFGLKLVFTCLVVTMFFKLLAEASEEIDS